MTAATPELRFDGPADGRRTVALAHGAGAPMDSPFMDFFATGLAERGYRVARFEFPYMVARRATPPRRPPPDRAAVLIDTWRRVIERLGARGLVIGGKSLGGRIASLVADEAGVAGLICLGYPFHPPGKPENLRVDHLLRLRTPTLILQGTRDPFGRPDEVAGYRLSPAIEVRWMADGDHSFATPRAAAGSEARNRDVALAAMVAFVTRLEPPAAEPHRQ